MSLDKDRLIFDTADEATSDSVGAYVRSSDGTLIDHVTIAAVDRLAVDATMKAGDGTDLTQTGGALDVNITNSSDIEVVSLHIASLFERNHLPIVLFLEYDSQILFSYAPFISLIYLSLACTFDFNYSILFLAKDSKFRSYPIFLSFSSIF